MTKLFPLAVEHDGPAACNLQDDCLFLNAPSGERVAVINHDLPDAVELAQDIANCVNLHSELIHVLRMARAELQYIYENSTIIPGRAVEDDRPIIEHVDAVLRDALALVRPTPPAPQCLIDAAALLKSFGLDSMVAASASELGVNLAVTTRPCGHSFPFNEAVGVPECPTCARYEASWGDGFVTPKTEVHGIEFFCSANCYDEETDRAAIAALKVGETWTSQHYASHTVKRIK